MAVSDLQRSGSNAFVAWHLARGYTEQETIAALKSRFGTFSAQDRRGAYNEGLRAWQAGEAVQQFNRPSPEGTVPSGGGDDQGYIYTLHIAVSGVPLEDGQLPQRTYQMYSDRPLSRSQLEIRIADNWANVLGSWPNTSKDRWAGSQPQYESLEVLSVERGR